MNIMMLLADMPALDVGAGQSSRPEAAASDAAASAADDAAANGKAAERTASPATHSPIEWRHSGYSEGEARRLLAPLYATRVVGVASDAGGKENGAVSAGTPSACLRVQLDDGSIYLEADSTKDKSPEKAGLRTLAGTAREGACEQDAVADLQKRLDAVLLWEHRLHAEAMDGFDPRRTLDIGRELAQHDIALFDDDFSLLAYSSGKQPAPASLVYTIEHGFAPPVSREQMQRYQKLDAKNPGGFEIAYVQPENAAERTGAPTVWVRSIKTRRGHLYHLHMVGVSEKDQGAIALFDSLADSLRAQLERLELSADVGLKEDFIQELVTGSRSEDELAERAWTFGFDPEGAFLAVRVQSIRYSYPRQRWEELCETFAREVPKARCAYLDEGIAVLVSGEEADDSLVGTLSRLACREKVHVGIGDPARGIRSAPRAYRQACDAIGRFGQVRERAARVILYDDCKPLIAREGIAKSNADGHLSPLCLQRAQAYDQAHGTEYVRTLMAYLRCARSKAKTCAELSVHRNTLEYRLSRMAELFGIDLDDKDLVGLLTLLAIAGTETGKETGARERVGKNEKRQ